MSENVEKYIKRKVYKSTSSGISQKFVDAGLEKLERALIVEHVQALVHRVGAQQLEHAQFFVEH